MIADLSSNINKTACPNCIPFGYHANGYEMLVHGDYSGFIQHYGWNMIIAGTLSFILIHYGNMALEKYYRRKKDEDNNR